MSAGAMLAGLPWGGPARAGAVGGRASADPLTQGIGNFIKALDGGPHEAHSMMIVRHGRTVAAGWWAPYRPNAPQQLYSLSKSFTSTAIGFAVDAGKLKASDRVLDFFPQQAPPEVSGNLAQLRIEHLLTMSVGHAADTTPLITREQDWVRAFLAQPVANPPGTQFVYNSGATYMLSAILQKSLNERLIDYLEPRLFRPLGLPHMEWAACPLGINTGGWGLSATTETISKFGQFYLQKGEWGGKPLLSQRWIDAATTFKMQQPAGPGQSLEDLKQHSDWHQGYAYQFWRCRHDAFRGDGAFGQYCVVLPRLDAVIAITSRTVDMQALLDLVWAHLLPGLANAASPDSAATAALRQDMAKLQLPPPKGAAASPAQPKAIDLTVEGNALGVERITVNFDRHRAAFTFYIRERVHRVDCGIGTWRDGETDLPGTPPEITELVGPFRSSRTPAKLAAAGAWIDSNTFQMQWRFYETPHFDTVTCRFEAGGMQMQFLNSITQMVSAHPESRPRLMGRMRT